MLPSEPPTDTQELKAVEFYSASVAAWYNTQLEHDKNLLALSAGGIGLLITLLTTVGVFSVVGLVLYFVSLCCFVTCLGCVLVIFKRNGKYIEVLVKGDIPPNDPSLQHLDSVAIYSFAAGVFFAVVLGFSAAITSYSNKEKEKIMANENKASSGKTFAQDSFTGAANLRPQQDMTKSFTGAENLRPPAPSSSTAGSATQGATTTQSSSQQSGNKK